MKKIFTLAMMMMAAVSMSAQWQPSDTEATKLDKPTVSGQTQMKTIRTDDGKIILTWLRWSEGLRYNDPGSGYYLHMQIFDANGNPQFGEEGILVSNKQTATSTTDYGLALAQNGDIVIAYTDARHEGLEEREYWEVYLYRYDQQGNPVWDADGIKFNGPQTTDNVSDMAPNVCVSDEYIYVSMVQTVYPSGSTQSVSTYLLQCFDEDGEPYWADCLEFETNMFTMQPCQDGDIYVLYGNEERGMDAQRISCVRENVWGNPINVDEGPLTGSFYFPKPECALDGEGGLMLTFRKLETMTGYQVVNHLSPDGEVLPQGSVMCRGSVEGDANGGRMAVRDDEVLVAWEQDLGEISMMVNNLSTDGDYMWGDAMYGRTLESGSSWGYTPVKVIPQEDGWVILYGNSTSWNGANFMVTKLDDNGETLWTRQIREDNFKSNGFSVVYDDQYAYIFYVQDEQYDDNWNVIPGSGGMYVMCVDINPGSTAISEVEAGQVVEQQIFNIKGQRLQHLEQGVNIVRNVDENGNVKTTKVMK